MDIPKGTLLDWRVKAKMSQEAAARLAQISIKTLQRAEYGHTTSRMTLQDICKVYGVTLEQVTDVRVSNRVYVRNKSDYDEKQQH